MNSTIICSVLSPDRIENFHSNFGRSGFNPSPGINYELASRYVAIGHHFHEPEPRGHMGAMQDDVTTGLARRGANSGSKKTLGMWGSMGCTPAIPCVGRDTRADICELSSMSPIVHTKEAVDAIEICRTQDLACVCLYFP